MKQVRLAIGLAAAFAVGNSAAAHAETAVARTAAAVAPPLGDPDAEIPYVPPRRVIAPPVYRDPGPPLNPGGVPYDEIFASPTPFDLPELLAPPDDPYAY